MKGNIFVLSMRIQLLFVLIILSSNQILQAARPTVNANNFDHTYLTCGSVILKWSNGNGNARMIVAREGSPVAFVPSDNSNYAWTSSDYGLSTPVGANSDEYVVYNGVGAGSLAVSNLKSGVSYYFTIYEHDNNGSNTLYLTSGAATYSVSTHYINMNFSITVMDSCEASNEFIFTNTSTRSILGLQDSFIVDGKTYNADQPVTYSFKNKRGYITVSLKNNNVYGCKSKLNKDVKIFPKRVANYDFLNSSDTTQDYIGNNFTLRTKGIIMPFPISVSYLWHTGDGNSTLFATLRHSYKDPGRYHTNLITTIGVNNKPTGCKDTQYLDLVVTGIKPFRSLSISPDRLPLKNNLFNFSLSDTGLSSVKWYFGDGNSSSDAITTHTYQDTGFYTVKVVATNKAGISDSTYKILIVDPDGDTTSINKTKVAVLSTYPNPASKQIDIQFKSIEQYQIKLFQMDGKICYEKTQSDLKEHLLVGELASGNYLLGIYQNGSLVQTFNIIIDK